MLCFDPAWALAASAFGYLERKDQTNSTHILEMKQGINIREAGALWHMRRGVGIGVFIIPGIVCDVIRLIPKCDSTCMKGRLLASYYPGPVVLSPAYFPGKSVAGKNPRTVKAAAVSTGSRRTSMSEPQTIRIPSVVRTTVTNTVLKTLVMEAPRSVQSSVVMVQPRYLVQTVTVSAIPMNAAVGPRQDARPPPLSRAAQPQADGLEAINRIGKRVNLIYSIVSVLKQRYLQAPPHQPGLVLVAPVVTMTVQKTVTLTPVQRSSTPLSRPPVAMSTLTKYVAQASQTENKSRVQLPSTACASPPKEGGKASQDTGKHRKTDAEESSSSDSSSMSSEKAEKPLYMLKSGGHGRRKARKGDLFIDCYLKGSLSRCTEDNLEGRTDIGDAVVYRNDFDSGDEVIYLSDLMMGG
uniref:Uncharacterized protein n=1 Tax=Encephalitozoon cuniculi TaxID=6035 RepID=M1KBL6_ENCCN|nr:hypothetical protein ECU08_1950 [Encephalitozoon cuniculi]